MKTFSISLLLLVSLAMASCGSSKPKPPASLTIEADSLVANPEKYVGMPVEIQGVAAHVCGVDGKKLKLRTTNGQVIKVEPNDSIGSFDRSLTKHIVSVRGTVYLTKLANAYGDSTDGEKKLLCHVDHTPCKDTAWVKRQVERGKADSIIESNAQALQQRIDQNGKGYVIAVTVIADKVEAIDKE